MLRLKIILVGFLLALASNVSAETICAKIHDEFLGMPDEPVKLVPGKIYSRNTDFYFQNPHDYEIEIRYVLTANDAKKKFKSATLKPYQWARHRGIAFSFSDKTEILPHSSSACEAFVSQRQKTFGDHAVEKGAIMGVIGGAALFACSLVTGGACLAAAPVILIL